jgi:hypothetical protein
MTHRDPAETLPSNASLIFHLRRATANVDALAVGREQLETWGHGIRRAMDVRRRTDRPAQFFDSRYVDFVRDPMGVVESIYAHFDMPLTQQARSSMAAFLADHRQDKHGRHIYDPATFDLDPAKVRRELGDYIEMFDIPVRKP